MTDRDLARIRDRELAELERRERRYRAGLEPLALDGLRVVLVDDGIATGATMLVAVRASRALGARGIVAAAPVAAADARDAVAREADRVVVLETPADFWAVGRWYRDFRQTEDAEVLSALRAARGAPPRSPR
ncbi:phosphoribosyltransferase family protein [Protaetiibacter sp. SSC-01]|uniref:phosphoribosyltransferase family protein n=1 Tax=Protaetiibacter sp. SSC-01 TaxID=2759943 RepID=UPI001CA3BC5A|nr:phosphoribosyltransferase family protein [Protaetiibacter sp. SSC-01]